VTCSHTLPLHYSFCYISREYYENDIYYIMYLLSTIKTTIQKKRPTSCTHFECTMSAVIMKSFINRAQYAPGRVVVVFHQRCRSHQHCRNSGAGGSGQRDRGWCSCWRRHRHGCRWWCCRWCSRSCWRPCWRSSCWRPSRWRSSCRRSLCVRCVAFVLPFVVLASIVLPFVVLAFVHRAGVHSLCRRSSWWCSFVVLAFVNAGMCRVLSFILRVFVLCWRLFIVRAIVLCWRSFVLRVFVVLGVRSSCGPSLRAGVRLAFVRRAGIRSSC